MTLLKRYCMPFVISIALYSIIYFVFGRGTSYLNAGLVLAILLSYLIRVCDDISDYEKDMQSGKVVFSKKALLTTACAIAVVCLAATVITGKYSMLIALCVILLQFAIKKKYRDIIKPLFMPGIVITLVVSFFELSAWIYLIASVLVILDVILIVCKKRRRNL